ncbi:ubiquitin specific protease [Naegleria gruberi]|uniref:Ubiquitin specific protease n=1 Tax=Naegleria gruberi TaxID=5762 RepID=D2VK51_NAEGR|nr:ubiquitin specific protease [Naegleria gruberi]EFC42886.1 ubiquitin specific protease [Naegleria gruberi]|eukprot:XP_002675630.1 ubiquitin specific protease [Naegleria gruberi strain NEG-M]
MSELFGDIFAGAGGMDEFEQHVASSSESEGVNQSYRVSTSMDQLKRQASNFVGLRNQSNILNLNLEKYKKVSGKQSDSEYEDVTIDFADFPYYGQLIDMGFEISLINRCFHKFVEPTFGSTDVNTRTQENMIMWLFEEQERQSTMQDFIPPRDGVIGSLFDNTCIPCSVDDEKLSSKRIVKKKKAQKQPNLLFVMQKLFSYMMAIEKPSIETTELTDAFGWRSRQVSVQHDIQELSRVFFSALETKLSKMKIDNFIKNTFAGVSVNKIVCNECGNTSCVKEDFYDITITVENTLRESLEKFVEVERFEGNNKYSCSKCNKQVDLAFRNTSLRAIPPIIFFSLTRFDYDFKTESRIKIKKEIKFESVLDMSPYKEYPGEPEEYELIGIIIHSGSPYSGHYYSLIHDHLMEGRTGLLEEEDTSNEKKKKKFAMEFEGQTHWFEFNDERVFEIDPKEEIPKYYGGKGASAYMLVYKRKEMDFENTKFDFPIPSYFKDDIDRENEGIKVMREYQEQQVDMKRQTDSLRENTGTAVVYLPNFFSVEKNHLAPINLSDLKNLYRSFEFHYDSNIDEFYQITREKFGDKLGDTFSLRVLNKEGKVYSISDQTLPKNSDDDDLVIRKYCDKESKYLYLLVLPSEDQSDHSVSDPRFNLSTPEKLTVTCAMYETLTDSNIFDIEYRVDMSIGDVIRQAKIRMGYIDDLPLKAYLRYKNKKPIFVTDMNKKMLNFLDGFDSIGLEFEFNEFSIIEELYQELERQKHNVKAALTNEDCEDIVIVKFGDREKIVRVDLNFTLEQLKKKILDEMFSSHCIVSELHKYGGENWIKECVMLRKQKKQFFKNEDSTKSLSDLDIGDGERIEIIIKLSIEKEVDIKFIEIEAKNTGYDETTERPIFNYLNMFELKVDQEASLKIIKSKLSQKFKKENWQYDNVYNFRFRGCHNQRPREIIKDEETLLSTLLIEQTNEKTIYIEIGKPPLNNQIHVKVNLVHNFPPKTCSSRILNENENQIYHHTNITASESWSLEFLKIYLLKTLDAFKSVENIKYLQIRDCTFTGGFKRMTKVYSDKIHLNKSLGKLRWRDTKVIAVKILTDNDVDVYEKLSSAPEVIDPKAKKKKLVIPPPLHIIVRLRKIVERGSESNFEYMEAKELIVNISQISSWDTVDTFKAGILSISDTSGSVSEFIVSKFSFGDSRIIRIEEDKPIEKVEEHGEIKKPVHLMRRINLSDGDVIVLTYLSDFEKDEIMKVHSTSLQDYEIERSSSKVKQDDDFFGFMNSGKNRAKEEALQILLEDSDDEDSDDVE